jgi:hypothetical protein
MRKFAFVLLLVLAEGLIAFGVDSGYIGTWKVEKGNRVVVISQDKVLVAYSIVNRLDNDVGENIFPDENGMCELYMNSDGTSASDGLGNVHWGYRVTVAFSISGDNLVLNLSTYYYNNTDGVSERERNQTFRLQK